MNRAQPISRKLRQVDYLYTKKLTKELSGIPVNNHFEVLLILAKQMEPITQNELAALLQIDKSRMTNILFQLENDKLVSIKVNPADRRQHYVSLSPDALTAIPYIEAKVQQVNEVAEADITEDKLKVFFEVAEIMRKNLITILL